MRLIARLSFIFVVCLVPALVQARGNKISPRFTVAPDLFAANEPGAFVRIGRMTALRRWVASPQRMPLGVGGAAPAAGPHGSLPLRAA
jgi:hypothetical protein